MNFFIHILLVCFLLYCGTDIAAQERSYSPANGHAHNDYLNARPFHQAYNSGFGSIEADVFPISGVLHVAHHKHEITPEGTLQALYLKPLLQALKSGNIKDIILLIDIKENHQKSLVLLIKELEPLKTYLNAPGSPKPITIIISGERPLPADYKNYPAYIYFDSDLKQKHTQEQWDRVALVSLAFNKLTGWKGETDPMNNELQPIKNLIDSVHQLGKRIRFWAAPDTKLSWQWQKQLGVDLVGTDKIDELRTFLKKNDD